MKIAIITDCLDDNAAGVGVYTRNLIENLLKIDKTNSYTLVHHTHTDNPFYHGKKELIIPMHKVPFYREFRKIFLMPRTLERLGFALVHDPMQIGPFFFKKDYKAVVTIHDLAPLLFPETFNWIVPFHHRYGLNRTLPNVDIILTDSFNTQKDIACYFPAQSAKVRVVHLGIAKNFSRVSQERRREFTKKHRLAKPFILYLGTLEPRKNIQALVKAFALLKKDKKFDCNLVIGGAKGWKYSPIFELIEKNHLSDDIIFLGFVPDIEMSALYSSASLFVFPSFYEGFGLPPLEAMKCGCPVITSNAASLPEVVGSAAITVKPQDYKALATAMHKVLTDNALSNRLIASGFANSSKFSWENCARNTLFAYNEALGAKSAGTKKHIKSSTGSKNHGLQG